MGISSRQKMVFYGLLLLSISVQAWGQGCYLDSLCSALSYGKQTIIGNSSSSSIYLSCPWRSSIKAVQKVNWMFSQDSSMLPRMLDIHSDPKLSISRFSLTLNDITSDYEGIYYCSVEYTDGTLSSAIGAGCAFVAGRAQFGTCPEKSVNNQCEGVTHLEGLEKGSVEFDARLNYTHGGDCGFQQSVRQMYLNRINKAGDSESLFICSNLGHFSARNCTNRTHVSITFQGEDKYNLKLSLHSLNMSNSGDYELLVNLNEMSSQRSTITKRFTVAVRANPTTPPATLPPSTTEAPVGIGCSKDSDPLLMLNGSIIESGSNLTFGLIQEKEHSLICVTPNKQCCDNKETGGTVTAGFLYPNGTDVAVVESCAHGVYVTRGKQMVRLNHVDEPGKSLPVAGSYCCSLPASDGSTKKSCINLQP